MSLIRRKSPNPAERALGFVRLGLKGLVAQRVARKAYKGYKLGRKLPVVLGLSAVAFVVARRAKGGASEPAPAPYTPPASTPTPAPTPRSEPAAPIASANGAAEPVAVAADDDGAPPIENTAAVDEVLETEATTPLTPAAAGTGGAEGEGVPTDEESAEESGTSTDAAPPKD